MDKNYKKIDLNIEAKDAHPTRPDFKWLGIMLVTVVGFFSFTYLCFSLFANIVVANISIEKEKEIFGDFFIDKVGIETFDDYYKFQIEIPEFQEYDIFVTDNEEKNAYTFLGAKIILTKSLIESLKYEEELQFIIAHEIGHIKTRDNLKTLARNLPFKITLFFIGFDIDLGFTKISNLTVNTFSRKAENNADKNAINLLKKHNINIYCASNFFEEIPDFPLEIMSTHPVNQDRIDNIKKNFIGKKSFENCTKISR